LLFRAVISPGDSPLMIRTVSTSSTRFPPTNLAHALLAEQCSLFQVYHTASVFSVSL
jgi:hypothetical protein